MQVLLSYINKFTYVTPIWLQLFNEDTQSFIKQNVVFSHSVKQGRRIIMRFLYLVLDYSFFYIIDPQFLAYLYNGLVPGVIYYKPLSYEANFLQA